MNGTKSFQTEIEINWKSPFYDVLNVIFHEKKILTRGVKVKKQMKRVYV
jgi:hypothetical protein